MNLDASNPLHHTARIKTMLDQIILHARTDVSKVSEPKAQALFEVTAEVLAGLRLAYEHYEGGTESGMSRTPRAIDDLTAPRE